MSLRIAIVLLAVPAVSAVSAVCAVCLRWLLPGFANQLSVAGLLPASARLRLYYHLDTNLPGVCLQCLALPVPGIVLSSPSCPYLPPSGALGLTIRKLP